MSGTANEVVSRLPELPRRVRDELVPLWRDSLRRERAHRLARSPIAEEKLREYFDLMGPGPRLEFIDRGLRLLDEILAADPAYVPALTERALLRRIAAGQDGEDPGATLRAARGDADEALRLAHDDGPALVAECLVVRSQIRQIPSDRDLDAAIQACSAASQAEPSPVRALYSLAQLYDQACRNQENIETLKLARERVQRFDRSWEGRVTFYLASAALQRNHVDEAEAVSADLLAWQAEEDRLGLRAPGRRAGLAPLQGAHLMRGAALLRAHRDAQAKAEFQAELARGAKIVGGLDEAVEAAALRGLVHLGEKLDSVRAARLAALEGAFAAADAKSPGPSALAGWYGFVDPESAIAWLDRRQAAGDCSAALQRATILRDAGHLDRVAQAVNACSSTEQWYQRCVRWVTRSSP